MVGDRRLLTKVKLAREHQGCWRRASPPSEILWKGRESSREGRTLERAMEDRQRKMLDRVMDRGGNVVNLN